MLTKISLLQIYLFIIIFSSSRQALPRSYEFKFYNFTCTPYTKIFSIFECNVTEAKEQLFLISGRFRLTKTMSNNFNFHMFFKVKSHMRKEYINFIDIKVNACDVMRSGAGNHMLEMIRRGVVKSLNAPFKCPFKKNFLYDLKNFSFTDEFFPAFMPFVNFTFGFDYYDTKTLIGSVRGLGEIAAKPKRRAKIT